MKFIRAGNLQLFETALKDFLCRLMKEDCIFWIRSDITQKTIQIAHFGGFRFRFSHPFGSFEYHISIQDGECYVKDFSIPYDEGPWVSLCEMDIVCSGINNPLMLDALATLRACVLEECACGKDVEVLKKFLADGTGGETL